MAKGVRSVEVSYLVHATEDGEKVAEAVARALGGGSEPVIEALEGHHGNPISKVTFQIEGEASDRAAASILSAIPSAVRRPIADEIELHLDEHGALYIRLDKQSVVLGRPALGDANPVRVRIKPVPFGLKEGPKALFQEMLVGA
jgi:RNA binding exosome subunit